MRLQHKLPDFTPVSTELGRVRPSLGRCPSNLAELDQLRGRTQPNLCWFRLGLGQTWDRLRPAWGCFGRIWTKFGPSWNGFDQMWSGSNQIWPASANFSRGRRDFAELDQIEADIGEHFARFRPTSCRSGAKANDANLYRLSITGVVHGRPEARSAISGPKFRSDLRGSSPFPPPFLAVCRLRGPDMIRRIVA